MKTPHKKDVQLRDIRKAAERIREIQHLLGQIKPQPLPKKIFAGHWRFITVRADVLRSSIGSQVQQVVDNCNHWVLGKKKEPKSYKCSTEIRYNSELSGYENGQGLLPLSEERWEKSGLPEFFKKKWFETVTRYIKAGTKNIPRVTYFPKIPKHMLDYGFKPAYIKEFTDTNGDLEGELQKLYTFMDTNHGWAKLSGRSLDEWGLSLDKKRKLERIRDQETQFEAREED